MNFPKTVKIKVYIATVLMFCILFATISYTSDSITIGPGSFVETASYVIWKDGSNYYRAKNGTTGIADFEDTNFTVVWNDVVDAAPGEIFIMAGDYEIDAFLFLGRGNIKITGAGYSTRIYPASGFFADHQWNNETNRLLWVHGNKDYNPAYLRPETDVENVEISHIRFDGMYRTFDVVGFGGNVSNFKMHDCWIEHANQRGLYSTLSWNSKIYNNYFTDCRTAMQLNWGQNFEVTNNHILGAYRQSTYAPIGKGEGIYANGAFNYTVTDNVIVGNRWDVATGDYEEQTDNSNSLADGIAFNLGYGLTISDNKIYNVYTTGIFLWWHAGSYTPWYSKNSTTYRYSAVTVEGNMIIGYGWASGGGSGICLGGNDQANEWGMNQTLINGNFIVQGHKTDVWGGGITLVNNPYATVSNNHVYNTTAGGINIMGNTGSNYTIVSNNLVANVDYDNGSSTVAGGIFVQNSMYVTLDGNICTDYQSTPTSDFGIYIYENCTYITLIGNTANPYQTVGIAVDASATNIKYSCNWNGTVWLSGDG